MDTSKRERVIRSAVRVLAVGAFCATTVSVRAATLFAPDLGPITAQPPLSARALSGLRGRYVGSDGVVYFGLQMVSRWTQADGSSLAVGTTLGLGLDSGGRPQLAVHSFSTKTAGTGKSAAQGTGTIQGNPIAGVSGIGQGIQTTGNDNVIKNFAVINVGAAGPGYEIGGAAGGSANIAAANGDAQGRVAFNGDSVIVAVNVPGQGVIQQTLGAQGLGQSAQVLSSANNVLNQMSLSVGFAHSGVFSAAQIGAILGTMKGL
ncbi:MAG: hypothetical protein ACYCTF_06665 [Acidiferrobacter sp.]